jgi:predicted Zn-dependent protease with MMP-like domain
MSRSDRLIADLDRGFAALEGGNLDAAHTIVERCRRIDRQHPDVIALSAAVADARGDVDDAIAEYGKLIELAPDDPVPRICIARMELHDVGDPDAALDMLEPAFDFIDEESDLIDALMLKAEALLQREEPVAARAALAELATSAIDDAELALDLADLAISAEDSPAALRWVEAALRAGPGEAGDAAALEADALHLRGRIHEAADEREPMIAAWQRVRTLDLAAPPGELAITEDELEKLAVATLAELPEKIRTLLERVPILIDDVPSEHIVADGWDPRILGLFQGSPMSDDGGLAPVVTTILLFKKNLERLARDREHLAEEIRVTVLHETAHYFGLDDDDLEALGLD